MGLLNPWAAAAALVAALVLAGFFVMTSRMNDAARVREMTLVNNGVQSRIIELQNSIQAEVIWDDAVTNLDTAYDHGWAAANIGQFLTQTSGFAREYVIDGNNLARFAFEHGSEVAATRYDAIVPLTSDLVAHVRKAEVSRGAFKHIGAQTTMISDPIQASAIANVDGTLNVLTASLVQPDFGTALPGETGAIVITGAEIDSLFLKTISDRFLLQDLTLRLNELPTHSAKASSPLLSSTGQFLGQLEWTPDTPGDALRAKVLPQLVVILLALGLAALTMYRRNETLTTKLVEEARAHEASRALAERAVIADRTKSTFLANMSHELRTPLNAIIGYSELMRDSAVEALREDDRNDHDRIIRAAHHLLGLVNTLLDLSKIEAGKMDVSIENTDVSLLLHDVADAQQLSAEKNGVTIHLHEDGDLSNIRTDEQKLRQCVLNLLSNACKFGASQRVDLRAYRVVTSTGERLRIEVQDRGIGIPPERIAQLFQPYTQADASIRGRFGGTGLGLAVTRELARLLGGDVTVRSELGKGSTFSLDIDAALAAKIDRSLADAPDASLARTAA